MDVYEERFWRKVDKGPHPNGCWLWTGGRSKNYGLFWDGRKQQGAHRCAWAFRNGPVPEGGMEICHSTECISALCVNPSHLRLDTHAANCADKMADPCRKCGGPRVGRYARPDGTQFAYCLPCKADYLAKYQHANKERLRAYKVQWARQKRRGTAA